jgi:chromosome segregation ATPase
LDLGSNPISLRRADLDDEESGGYTFEHLEGAVAELADSRRQFQVENGSLRGQLRDKTQRLQDLEERLLEANQRRLDALKRIDDLIARLDQIDAEFEAAEQNPRGSKRAN